jgi:HAMP domain-containing protein
MPGPPPLQNGETIALLRSRQGQGLDRIEQLRHRVDAQMPARRNAAS